MFATLLQFATSLRARLLLGTCAMLLPLVVLAVAGYLLFNSVIDGFNNVVDSVFRQMVPVSFLEKSVEQARAVLRADAGGDRDGGSGAAAARARFREISQHTDETFHLLIEASSGFPTQLSADLQAAYAAWLRVRTSGRHMLSLGPGDAERDNADMAQIAEDINLLERQLQGLHQRVLHSIDAQLATARRTRDNILYLIVGICLLGLLVAVAVGYLLAYVILKPLRMLHEGAQRFGAGDLSYRIDLVRNNELGRLAETFNTMADLIEKNQSHLKTMAIVDALTGLYNRRELGQRLNAEVERARRYAHSFALLLFDADNFKSVNDQYGHPVGDMALRTIADMLREHVRPVDSVARYGGEEFAILLPETELKAALNTAERLRQRIADEAIEVGAGKTVHVTVSVGVALFPRHGRSSAALLHSADQALYQAKAAGRNCVILA